MHGPRPIWSRKAHTFVGSQSGAACESLDGRRGDHFACPGTGVAGYRTSPNSLITPVGASFEM
jgi:hypothetical protein